MKSRPPRRFGPSPIKNQSFVDHPAFILRSLTYTFRSPAYHSSIICRSSVDHLSIICRSSFVYYSASHFSSAQVASKLRQPAWPAPVTSPTASDQLKALTTTSSRRSKTARLKDLVPDIDHAMQSGVPRSEILQILSAAGLEMTMSYFDVARRRIKKLSSASCNKLDSTSLSNNSKANIYLLSTNFRIQHKWSTFRT